MEGSRKAEIEQRLHRARSARQAGDTRGEMTILKSLVADFPSDPAARNACGMRALADRDFAHAVDHFHAATLADPGQPALWLNLATAQRAMADDDGERHSLEAALAIDQRQFTAQLRMAELLHRLGLLSQSVRHWSAVIQLAEGFEKPLHTAISEACARGRAVLAEHNDAFEAALTDDLGGAVSSGEDDRRFAACVDRVMGRRRFYQNECAGIHYPFLPADEFFPRALFPWLGAVEAKTDAIRAEARAMFAGTDPAIRPYVRLEPGTPASKWTPLDNSLDWSACFLWEYGVRNAEVCARCPETAAIVDAIPRNVIPGKAPSVFFSVLRPHAHIPPHTGVTNTRAIVHLPLIVPPDCRFRVGGETRAWCEGTAFAFDDTIEHEAHNDSDQPRIILIFDVWNPYLTVREQQQLTSLFAVADRGLTRPKR